MRRNARLLSAVFAVFIMGVAALRDWIHEDHGDDAVAASEPDWSGAEAAPEPDRLPPAPGPSVDGAQLVRVHAGTDGWDGAPARALGAGEKWIAVDVELTVAAGSSFAFEDLAVLVEGRVESRDPVVEPLDEPGAPADHRRVRLAYVVPSRTREVGLAYGTVHLTRSPIVLARR
jgi:hypothetical protein